MPEMVWVSLENGEGAIQLLEYHHPGEFVRESHLAKRQGEIRLVSGVAGEAVGRADCEHKRLRIAFLAESDELGHFPG